MPYNIDDQLWSIVEQLYSRIVLEEQESLTGDEGESLERDSRTVGGPSDHVSDDDSPAQQPTVNPQSGEESLSNVSGHGGYSRYGQHFLLVWY